MPSYCLLVSFNLNSLLVFFYAIGGTLLLLPLKGESIQEAAITLWQRIKSLPELLVLPVVFWLGKAWITPVAGHELNYNKPSFSPIHLLNGYKYLWDHLILSELLYWFKFPIWILIATLVTILIGIAASKAGWQLNRISKSDSFGRCILVGFFLVLSAAFPYIVVGQDLADDGWLSRNSILLGMPLGMLIVGILGWLNNKFASSHPMIWLFPLGIIIALCILKSNRNILELSAYGAKQESIRIQLRQIITQSQACVIQLRDYYLIPGTISYYPPIIWTYIVAYGDKRPRTFVIDITASAPPQKRVFADGTSDIILPSFSINSASLVGLIDQTTVPWFLNEVPREGPQRMVVVEQGTLGNAGARIGAKYLWLNWFHPDELNAFLKELTKITIFDIPPVSSS